MQRCQVVVFPFSVPCLLYAAKVTDQSLQTSRNIDLAKLGNRSFVSRTQSMLHHALFYCLPFAKQVASNRQKWEQASNTTVTQLVCPNSLCLTTTQDISVGQSNWSCFNNEQTCQNKDKAPSPKDKKRAATTNRNEYSQSQHSLPDLLPSACYSNCLLAFPLVLCNLSSVPSFRTYLASRMPPPLKATDHVKLEELTSEEVSVAGTREHSTAVCTIA